MTNKALAKFYKVPEFRGKITTGADELEYLFEKTKDPVFDNILKLRRYDTILNNYILNWKPSSSGRVHTTWGFSAASGQIDSRNPNVLNISKHTEIGQRFRRCLIAPKGFKFIEFDKKSFHVATMGYLANDPSYIRFSQLDPHSIFASYIMPSEWGRPISFNESDESILEQCRFIKKRSKQEHDNGGIDLRQAAKACVLGNQLGLGAHKLWYQNRLYIKDQKEAFDLQTTLNNVFDLRIQVAQAALIQKAHKETRLIDEWGKNQYFYEVFRWTIDRNTGQWKQVRTDQAEKVLAFRVQGSAFGMLKWEHLKMEDKGWNDKYNFINTIHDSLVFLPRDSFVEECLCNVGQVMNSPCEVLRNEATGPKGLTVKVEASVGSNLADYSEANPEGMKEVKLCQVI